MPLNLLEGALGGIGLFLLGMRIMSDGIRTVADARIRGVFAAITSNRFNSMLFGIVLSLVLNSPSAAVIFAVGLANGGVLNTFQAVNVLAGVLLGGSLSLYLPIVPYGVVATPLVFLGVLLKFFARRRRMANAGDLLLGAGLLFLGLTLLEGSFRPSDSHPFYDAFRGAFFREPLLAFFFGSMLSWFVQSAISVTAIVGSLQFAKHIAPNIGSVMILGGILGVAAIGLAAAIGGTSVSRRIATSFFIITLVVAASLSFIAPMLTHSHWMLGTVQFNELAWIHAIGSATVAILCVSLSGVISRWMGAVDTDGKGGIPQPCAGYLDLRIINTPTLAIEQARKEIVRMMSVTSYMYGDVRELLFEFDARRAETIRQHEQVLDSLNHEITGFLASLARSTTNPDISYEIPGLLQTVTDLEHIGDRCEDVLNCILEKKESGILFSNEAMEDLKRLSSGVSENVIYVESLLKEGAKPDPDEVRAIKSASRATSDEIKQLHFDRICSGVCPPRAAMLYNELSGDFIRIAELCWNIVTIQGRKPA